jgi:3-deoxy-manno-octulosonate cytidylyltransferase (CMP-KDO synthetase)
VDAVVVATDSEKVAKAVRAAGAEAVLTAESHRTGTERVAEVARAPGFDRYDVIVNVQGDEPLVDPGAIDACVEATRTEGADLGTVMAPGEERDSGNPNVVKVVVDAKGFALYFSRAPIPFRVRRGRHVRQSVAAGGGEKKQKREKGRRHLHHRDSPAAPSSGGAPRRSRSDAVTSAIAC